MSLITLRYFITTLVPSFYYHLVHMAMITCLLILMALSCKQGFCRRQSAIPKFWFCQVLIWNWIQTSHAKQWPTHRWTSLYHDTRAGFKTITGHRRRLRPQRGRKRSLTDPTSKRDKDFHQPDVVRIWCMINSLKTITCHPSDSAPGPRLCSRRSPLLSDLVILPPS